MLAFHTMAVPGWVDGRPEWLMLDTGCASDLSRIAPVRARSAPEPSPTQHVVVGGVEWTTRDADRYITASQEEESVVLGLGFFVNHVVVVDPLAQNVRVIARPVGSAQPAVRGAHWKRIPVYRSDYRAFVKVQVEGQPAGDWELDTARPESLLTRAKYPHVEMPAKGKQPGLVVGSINARRKLEAYKVNLTIEGLTAEATLALLQPADHGIGVYFDTYDGVLGLEFFQHWRTVVFDLGADSIYIDVTPVGAKR